MQTPEETLERGHGSCRDIGWLLVQLLRHLGLRRALRLRLPDPAHARRRSRSTARRAPSATSPTCTPGPRSTCPAPAGSASIPTSGLLAGEGHIPLACTPRARRAPRRSAALVDECEVEFAHHDGGARASTRRRASPSRTPRTQWARDRSRSATQVDAELQPRRRAPHDGRRADLRLDRRPRRRRVEHRRARARRKRRLAGDAAAPAARALRAGRPAALRPGQVVSGRAAAALGARCYWRARRRADLARPDAVRRRDAHDRAPRRGRRRSASSSALARAARASIRRYVLPGLRGRLVLPVARAAAAGQRRPAATPKLDDEPERARLRACSSSGLGDGRRLRAAAGPPRRSRCAGGRRWRSGRVVLPRASACSCSPATRRWASACRSTACRGSAEDDRETLIEPRSVRAARRRCRAPIRADAAGGGRASARRRRRRIGRATPQPRDGERDRRPQLGESAAGVVRTALCVEPRDGRLYVFLPPLADRSRTTSSWSRRSRTTAARAATCRCRSKATRRRTIRGWSSCQVTPDPGVIEVNIHPAASWARAGRRTPTHALRGGARRRASATEKFMLDGRHTGTGGGNHIVLGGADAGRQPVPAPARPAAQPDRLLAQPSVAVVPVLGPVRRPDQPGAARRRGARRSRLRAGDRVRRSSTAAEPATRRRPGSSTACFRNLLIDVTGNTHRAEFCIDKLYSPDSADRPARACSSCAPSRCRRTRA